MPSGGVIDPTGDTPYPQCAPLWQNILDLVSNLGEDIVRAALTRPAPERMFTGYAQSTVHTTHGNWDVAITWKATPQSGGTNEPSPAPDR